jgi:sulfate transport system ATP-binding protein
MSISVRNVTKRFGEFTALDDVSVEVPSGALVALLGPSGSGKTTLLRIIAGLEEADAGTVYFQGQDAGGRDVRQRNIGFVFQHYALFRHMTVADNIGFALKMRRRPKAEIKERVRELLRLVQLEQAGRRYPAQLSGGQRQRVALARALAARPEVLLLDEPFGALDARVRQELRDWLHRLHAEVQVTSVFVTHDQEEALELADRVVVMNRGRVEQTGSPDEVYHHPANPFVMKFLGRVNLFHGRVEHGQVVVGGLAGAEAPGTEGGVVGYARPHHLEISRVPEGVPSLPARVERIHAAGSQVRVDATLLDDDRPVEVILSQERFAELGLATGEMVYVRPREIKVFEGDYVI